MMEWATISGNTANFWRNTTTHLALGLFSPLREMPLPMLLITMRSVKEPDLWDILESRKLELHLRPYSHIKLVRLANWLEIHTAYIVQNWLFLG